MVAKLFKIAFLVNWAIIHIIIAHENINQETTYLLNNTTNICSEKKNKNISYIVMIYMAADNDLFPFAGRNMKQMQNIGSNEQMKIIIHFDMHRPGQKKTTKRFFVEKNKINQIGTDMHMNSGDITTLTDFCKWSIDNYSSSDKEWEYVLVIWNHGSGQIEPNIQKSINPAKLFNYNIATQLIELNRNIGFLDYLKHSQNQIETNWRGICFDDTTGNYITNQKLKEGLKLICENYLHGKKIAILACDACLMSGLEVIEPLAKYVDFFVGSQEVELGTGYKYDTVLAPFITGTLNKKAFAKHIVDSYREAYSKITNDFTQSAIDLSNINLLTKNIDQIAQLLMLGLLKQKNKSVKDAIRLSRHKNFCTHFDEPTYIDLGHFYSNLLKNVSKCELIAPILETNTFKQSLKLLIKQGIEYINTAVVANAVGKNLSQAKGISIYFPEHHIHHSYRNSEFAIRTHWLEFLKQYLML